MDGKNYLSEEHVPRLLITDGLYLRKLVRTYIDSKNRESNPVSWGRVCRHKNPADGAVDFRFPFP